MALSLCSAPLGVRTQLSDDRGHGGAVGPVAQPLFQFLRCHQLHRFRAAAATT
jgi:hypothetical protein